MTSIVVLAAEAEEATGLDLVLPAWAELVWGLIGFALLLAFLWGRVFPLINKALEDRQRSIQGRIEEAEQARQEAEHTREEYEQRLRDAREESDRMVAEAREQGERSRADIVSNAEDEARQIVERAQSDAESTRTRLLNDLRGQVAIASVELAGRIVQRELDPQRHRDLVDEYINELAGMDGRR